MIEVDVLVLFFTTSVLLAFAPGPDNLFVMAQSAQQGRMAGFVVTLGLCTGLIAHTAAVAFGLAAVVKTSALAFSVLKLLGAAYLIYLAWQAFRAAAAAEVPQQAAAVDSGKLYRRGIIMNITNPKVSIFFLAFLPQFTDPAKGAIALQIILLGCLFIVATILVFGAISIFAGTLGEKFRRSARAQRVLNCIAGSIFAGLAVKLMITRQ